MVDFLLLVGKSDNTIIKLILFAMFIPIGEIVKRIHWFKYKYGGSSK